MLVLPDEKLLRFLQCPADRTALRVKNDSLACENSHFYRMDQGIPVFTDNPRREPVPLNMGPCPHRDRGADPNVGSVDSFVNDWIVNTNGNLYWRVRGRLPRYPIGQWPFGSGDGKSLLDIGCGWGRWSIAASRAGFDPIGLDVHVDALAAANRITRQLGARANFVCADAEHLPFARGSFDCVFSYSVLQHLEKLKVHRIFREIARVLKPGGICLVQLPNQYGPLSILQQARRGFREAKSDSFEMRYWSRKSIQEYLEASGLSDVAIHTDGFFSQNPQLSDLDLLSPVGKLVVLASYAGRKAADRLPILSHFADSLWIEARAPTDSQ